MRALVVIAASALAVVGCGVPTDTRATTSGPDAVPFGLLDEQVRAPAPTALTPAGPVAELYFVAPDGGRLTAVQRPVERGDPSEVVEALLDGPSDLERGQGVTTALTVDDPVRTIELTGGVAAVDLAPAFSELEGASQRLALAQLVYTLTARPGIGRVSFSLEGQPVEIPRGDGTLTSGSVSRDNYRELAPPS